MSRVRTDAAAAAAAAVVERARRTTCLSGIHLDDGGAGRNILRLVMIIRMTALLIRVFVVQRQGVMRPGRRFSLLPPPRGAGGGVGGAANVAAPDTDAWAQRRRPTGNEMRRLVGVYGAIVGIRALVVLVPAGDISVVTMVATTGGTIPPSPSSRPPGPPSQIPPQPP